VNAWELPTSLQVGGVGYSIRTDFRDVLRVLSNFSSSKYNEQEKAMATIIIMFPAWKEIPQELYGEALEQVTDFIDAGIAKSGKESPATMDWDKDAPIIIPAVNRVLGKEIRAMEYLHWWTFVAAYMEIGRSLFSSVVSIRKKRLDGEKLDDEEKKFLRENRELIELKQERSEEEKEFLSKLIGKKVR
jgi:hypothetical protein